MPFVFIIIGTVFVVSGALGTSNSLLALLKDDLMGQNSFIFWVVSIAIIGALGYVDGLRGFSRAMLALVLVVLLLEENKKNAPGGGFFSQFQKGITEITGKAAA